MNGLRAWADVEPSADQRIALLREAAELAHRELSQSELAADCYQELIAIDENEVGALRALCDIRRAQSRWNEVVGLLERQLEVVEGTSARQWRRRSGRSIGTTSTTHGPRFGPTRAALELDEDDPVTMNALEALYQDNDRLEALRALLERRARLAPATTERRFSSGSRSSTNTRSATRLPPSTCSGRC